jgi:hypothetical protein
LRFDIKRLRPGSHIQLEVLAHLGLRVRGLPFSSAGRPTGVNKASSYNGLPR